MPINAKFIRKLDLVREFRKAHPRKRKAMPDPRLWDRFLAIHKGAREWIVPVTVNGNDRVHLARIWYRETEDGLEIYQTKGLCGISNRMATLDIQPSNSEVTCKACEKQDGRIDIPAFTAGGNSNRPPIASVQA